MSALVCSVHTDEWAVSCRRCWGDRWPYHEERERVVEIARSLVGVPFAHRGRSRSGVDCVGVLYVIARGMGWPAPEADYGLYPDSNQMGALLEERMVLAEGLAYPGDVLWVRVRRSPQHVLVLTDCGTVIHALWRQHVVEHTFDERWAERVLAVWRFRELAA